MPSPFRRVLKSFVPLLFLLFIPILGIILYCMLSPSYMARRGDALLLLISVIETCRVDSTTKARLLSTCVSEFAEGGLRKVLDAALFSTLAAAASGSFLVLIQCIRASCFGLSRRIRKENKPKRGESPRLESTPARENEMESIKERLCDLMPSPSIEEPNKKLLKMVVFLYDDKDAERSVKVPTEINTRIEDNLIFEREVIHRSEPRWVGWISIVIVFLFALHLCFLWAYILLMISIPISRTWKLEYIEAGTDKKNNNNNQVGIETKDLTFSMSGSFVMLTVLAVISMIFFGLEVAYMCRAFSLEASHEQTESSDEEKEEEMAPGHLLPGSLHSNW